MSDYRVNLLQPSVGLLFATVRLETEEPDGQVGSGTAFFFEEFNEPGRPAYLVTNRHVLQGARRVRTRFHTGSVPDRTSFRPAGEYAFEMDNPDTLWTPHPDPGIDLCAISVAELREVAGGRLDSILYTPLRDIQVPAAGEDSNYPAAAVVTMVGYPIGLWDEVNNLPVLRRGITASHPAVDFDGRPALVVDIGCFPGSSGSPVLMTDDFFPGSPKLLGVLHAGPTYAAEGAIVIRNIPTRRVPVALTSLMTHLGYIIKAREVVALARSLRHGQRTR